MATPLERCARSCTNDNSLGFSFRHGYIVKRKLISAETLAPFVDRFWEELVPPCIDRSDKTTWVDPGKRAGWAPRDWVVAETARAGRTNRAYPGGYVSCAAAFSFTAPPLQLALTRSGGHLRVSQGESNIQWQAVGGERGMVDATCAHPAVLRMVESLVGGRIKRPHRNRGMYVHFPRSEPGGLGPHNDSMPAELFGMVYLDHVPPFSGGTCVWPT